MNTKAIQILVINLNPKEQEIDSVYIKEPKEKERIINTINNGINEPRVFYGKYRIEVLYENNEKKEFLLTGKYIKTEGYTYTLEDNLEDWIKTKYFNKNK